jgi:hypothetical protein
MGKYIVCPKCDEENPTCDLCQGGGKVDANGAELYWYKQSLAAYNPYHQISLKKIEQRTKYL